MNRDLNARREGVSHVDVWGKRIPGTRSRRGTKALRLEHSCPVTGTQWEPEHQEHVMRPELSVLKGDGRTDSGEGRGWGRRADRVRPCRSL